MTVDDRRSRGGDEVELVYILGMCMREGEEGRRKEGRQTGSVS